MKKGRKTRVTKKDIIKAREERKITSSQRKRKIIPGPWTNIEPTIKVNVDIKLNTNSAMASVLGPVKGTYVNDDTWNEKGWYPITFNLEAKNIKGIIKKHGIDQFLAASEKALSNKKDKNGKLIYGNVVILNMSSDNSQRKDKENRFVSCRGKTNKKNISGFRAIRKREYITL